MTLAIATSTIPTIQHARFKDLKTLSVGLIMRRRIQRLIDFFRNEEIFTQWVNEAISHHCITAPSLFSHGNATCYRSLYADRNCLCFVDGSEHFFIIQYNYLCYGIYIPSKQLFLSQDGDARAHTIILNELQSLQEKHQLDFNSEAFRQGRFLGVTNGCVRPYHYIYDRLPFLFDFLTQPSLHPLPVLSDTNSAFLSSAALFGNRVTETFVSDYNDVLIPESGFCIETASPAASRQKKRGRAALFEFLYTGYIPHSDTRPFGGDTLLAPLEGASCIVWMGVCSEKRQWLQQKKGFFKMLDYLTEVEEAPAVIFDSMTAPVAADVSNYRNNMRVTDIAFIDEIRARYGDRLIVCDAIGCHMDTKLLLARRCDFYFANGLTDAMVIAAMARVPGIAYTACDADKSLHLHPRTTFIPDTFITDRPTGRGSWATIDVAMDSDAVFAFFKAGLETQRTLRGRPCFPTALPRALGIDAVGRHTWPVTLRHTPSSERVTYLPLYDTERSVHLPGKRPQPLLSRDYQIFFDHTADATLNIQLAVVGYANGVKKEVFFTPLHTSSITCHFSAAITHYRLFLRIEGHGTCLIRGLHAQPLFPDVASLPTPQASLCLTTPESSTPRPSVESLRDLTPWDRPVYNHESIHAFLQDHTLADGIHAIAYHGVYLEFNLNRKASDALVIFFNAAMSVRGEHTKLPAFSGRSAVALVPANILMISDPSLYLSDDIRIGWYAGSEAMPLQQDLPPLLRHIQRVLGIQRTVLYGASGGGFAALYYAPFLDNAIAVPCNPQTNLLKYSPNLLGPYLRHAFSYEGDPDAFLAVSRAYTPTISVNAEHLKNVPVLYLQNAYDPSHYSRFFLPFIASYGGTRTDRLVEKHTHTCVSVRSEGWGKGHLAAPGNFLFPILELLIQRDGWKKAIAAIPRLYTETKRLFDKVILTLEDGALYGEAILDNPKEKGRLTMRLMCNKTLVESHPVVHGQRLRFDATPTAGLYQIETVLRHKDFRQMMRSKRLVIDASPTP